MARIVKKADERRTEILEAAQRLFMSRGYDATTVNDLISAVGISKGAFYHHFSSKDDVLRALVWNMAEQGLAAVSPLFEREDITPLEKLKSFFNSGQQYKKENAPALRLIIEVLFRKENLRLRLQAAEQMTEIIAPHLGRVLEEGAKTGEFDIIDDPVETARLVLNLGALLHEAFAVALKLAKSGNPDAILLLRKRTESCERAIERILGITEDSLSIVDPELIELFLAPISAPGESVSRGGLGEGMK
jgi:AcrR family transcriptional regulator